METSWIHSFKYECFSSKYSDSIRIYSTKSRKTSTKNNLFLLFVRIIWIHYLLVAMRPIDESHYVVVRKLISRRKKWISLSYFVERDDSFPTDDEMFISHIDKSNTVGTKQTKSFANSEETIFISPWIDFIIID
jgi:hypothetical protein